MVLLNIKIILLVLLLMKPIINAKTPENLLDIEKKMIKLLLTCFDEYLNMVITTPDLYENFLEASLYSRPIPIILMDENFITADVQRPLLHLATFVFAPHSTESLGVMLQTVKASRWWHINSLFFIVGNMREGCKPATEILNRTWKMNLLSSLFLCYEQNKGMMLYTYNPYTNRAPHPWKKVEVHIKTDDHWTLYAQRYREGQKTCASVNFDKMKFMDGYKIKSIADIEAGVNWTTNTTYNLDSLSDKLSSINIATFLQTLFAAMNLSATINYIDLGSSNNATEKSFLKDLINRSYDMSLSAHYLAENTSSIWPLTQTAPRIVTQQRNFLTPVEKILAFYSNEIWYLTAIVLLITFVFILMIYKKREFAFAAFDVLRLLLSVGLSVPFNRTATRIFIFCAFQLIIILNATFQGNISSFLTRPERHYVDNLKSVQSHGLTAIAPTFYKHYIESSYIQMPAINYVHGKNCIKYVTENYSLACIGDTPSLLKPALKHNLHISLSSLKKKYLTFFCRDDWPLKKKFDYYILRLIEAALFEYLYDHHVNIPLKKLKGREEQATSTNHRPIQLANLAFAFRFLAIGLGISTFVFMIEMLPRRKVLQVMKKMKNKRGKSSVISKLR